MEKKNGLYFRKANAKPIVVPSYSVETYFAVSEEQAERENIKRCICPELPDNHHVYSKMLDLPDDLYESKEYTMGSTIDYADKMNVYKELLLKEDSIKSNLSYAEWEFAPYAEYL